LCRDATPHKITQHRVTSSAAPPPGAGLVTETDGGYLQMTVSEGI